MGNWTEYKRKKSLVRVSFTSMPTALGHTVSWEASWFDKGRAPQTGLVFTWNLRQ